MTGRAVEREIAIDAPVAAVWRALTDAEELMRWFPLEARVTPGPGGAIWMGWRDHYAAESRIDAWEPERYLRIAFPAHEPYVLATDYYLEGRSGRTVLRVVTSGFGDDASWDAMLGGVRRGWEFELAGLRHYLERHRHCDRRVAWARHHPFHGAPAEAWRRLTAPGGWLGDAGLPAVVAGATATLRTPGGCELTGPVLIADPPHQFAMIARELDDALVRLEIEAHDSVGAVAWLACWSPQPGLADLEARWRTALHAVMSR